MADYYDDYDPCYECGGYGDDYFINDEGELECYCPHCHVYKERMEDDEEVKYEEWENTDADEWGC